MPVLLDDIDLSTSAAPAPVTDAKFFSAKFTGNGRTASGLLGSGRLPTPTTSDPSLLNDASQEIRRKTTTMKQPVAMVRIPIAPILGSALKLSSTINALTLPALDPSERFEIPTNSTTHDFSLFLTPQAATLYEDTTTGQNKMPREFIVQYRMEFFIRAKGIAPAPRAHLIDEFQPPTTSASSAEHVVVRWSVNPMAEAKEFIEEQLSSRLVHCMDADAVQTWLSEDYNVHDQIVRQAEVWSSHQIAEEMRSYISVFGSNALEEDLNRLAIQLRYLENYPIPLEAYTDIHHAIKQTFDNHTTSVLAKQNINLLVNNELYKLHHLRPHLIRPIIPLGGLNLPHYLSTQQRDAVSTTEPLVMVQAGAGTGKTTVITERIKALTICGVDISDITVLSFTNIAADTVLERNPGVGSMTIARMITDIYSLNHPTHELSSTETLTNSLEIFFASDPVAATLRRLLADVDKLKVGAMTTLNIFIERYNDAVMRILDTIKQTTLELQIIVCYQQIETMREPPHVASRYLIIDEVQDNSIFEFVYLLKYVAKHRESLFIVGDASQTLFEFRAANPRALNTLEASGVFATFKLTNNYRSNQEILDFANVLLGSLETNQIAGIQLRANSLQPVTADSFQEKVTIDYRHRPKVKNFINEELAVLIQGAVAPQYIDAALTRGEQVALLAFSRREVAIMQRALQETYPDRTVASLVMERPYTSGVFSSYIRMFWNDVLQVQPQDAAFTVVDGVKKNLPTLVRGGSNPKTQKAIGRMIQEWWIESAPTLRGWIDLVYQAKTMSHAEFFDNLRENLLAYEIRYNNIRQSVTRARNKRNKESREQLEADLIVSTVHGAKGLEFDNVVVIHKEDPSMSEETKRLFYVAFTRAKKTEYVLSYGATNTPPIVSSYMLILSELQHRERAARARELGISLEELEKIEAEQENTD